MRRRVVLFRRAGERRRRVVVFRRAGDLRRRVVVLRRRVVDLRRAGERRRRVVVLRRAGDFRRATVLLRVVFLRAMFFALLFGVFRRRVDFLRFPEGFTITTSFNAIVVALDQGERAYGYNGECAFGGFGRMPITNGKNRNSQVHDDIGGCMGGPRHAQREMASKEKLSITLDKDVFDYIEYGIRMRWWPSRSAGVNLIIAQFMRQQVPAASQPHQQQPSPPQGMMGQSPHSTQGGWRGHPSQPERRP